MREIQRLTTFIQKIFKKVCIKTKADLTIPKIGNVGGVLAADAKDKTNPPLFKYAVVELEIHDYDRNVPPVIRVFDEFTNKLLDTVKFKPLLYPCEPLMPKLAVPIFLAYDPNPWKNADKEPEACVTRIELYMPVLDHVETVYAKLEKGIFVVPVFWHNIAESSRNGESYVNNQHVIDLFWTAPTGKDHNDVNSIWAQAGIQFRLINTNVPFHLASIPTHLVDPPDKSFASDCILGWKNNFSNKEAVDIYAVYDLKAAGISQPVGIGNCWAEGYVLIKADDPKYQNPGFTDALWLAEARAILVAHEFGHYLGYLGHQNAKYDNLMHEQLSGWKLEQFQIDQIRQQIKSKGYNESK